MPTTQTGPYIPQDDNGVRLWLNQFALTVQNDPAAAGLTQADADVLTALAAEYDAAYALANTQATRTTGSVTNKDVVRNQAVETFRVYALQIKQNLGVTEETKNDLGIHLDDPTRTPIPAPTTVPLLTVTPVSAGVQQVNYSDSSTPGEKRKPAGAIQLQLFRVIDAAPVANPDDAIYYGSFTRSPITVSFDPADAGKTVTFFARWITRTGLVGAFSAPVAMQIAFGGPVESLTVTGGTPQSLGGSDLKIAA